jgi:hypothetical protein
MAAFVWEFQEYGFVENILLVSSIGERLGKGVTGADGDLLIGAVQESLRSTLGRERELLPFAPPEDSD